jgi:4-hydroxy-2-oxoheptanedioate aldolase
MFLKSQVNLLKQLKILKKNFGLVGIKVETEAEGASHEDIKYLLYLSRIAQTKIFVKIGGCEANNDIRFCTEIGVDGIISPMIETEFAAYKFINSIEKLDLKIKPNLSINIETKTGVENIKSIFKIIKNKINNITVGRSDLSLSYFKKNIYPNSKFITKKIFDIYNVVKKSKITITTGGSIDSSTIKIFSKINRLSEVIDKLESRKVILPFNSFVKNNKALDNAIKFEKLYILMKNEINDFRSKSDTDRLALLNTRL